MAQAAGRRPPIQDVLAPQEPERLRRARREDQLLTAYSAAMGVLAGLLGLAALLELGP